MISQDNEGGTANKIKQLIDESDGLKKEVENYKKLLDKKECEMKTMEHQLERKHEVIDEQLAAIKDEIR